MVHASAALRRVFKTNCPPRHKWGGCLWKLCALGNLDGMRFQTVKNATFATGHVHSTEGGKVILCLLLLQVNQGWPRRKCAVGFHPSWCSDATASSWGLVCACWYFLMRSPGADADADGWHSIKPSRDLKAYLCFSTRSLVFGFWL